MVMLIGVKRIPLTSFSLSVGTNPIRRYAETALGDALTDTAGMSGFSFTHNFTARWHKDDPIPMRWYWVSTKSNEI